MAILRGYLSTERGDILHRKEQLKVALELLRRGFGEQDKQIAKVGMEHSFKYLKMDIDNLSVAGLYHWNNVKNDFYGRYYAMVKELDYEDILLQESIEMNARKDSMGGSV